MTDVAAMSDSSRGLSSEYSNTKSDIAIQVGGANPGTTLSANMTKNSGANEVIGAGDGFARYALGSWESVRA